MTGHAGSPCTEKSKCDEIFGRRRNSATNRIRFGLPAHIDRLSVRRQYRPKLNSCVLLQKYGKKKKRTPSSPPARKPSPLRRRYRNSSISPTAGLYDHRVQFFVNFFGSISGQFVFLVARLASPGSRRRRRRTGAPRCRRRIIINAAGYAVIFFSFLFRTVRKPRRRPSYCF